MTSLSRLSESVYVGLCDIVGTSQQVATRREIIDTREIIELQSQSCCISTMILSGSYREGFRLHGSDMDFMIWLKNHKVLYDVSQINYYDRSKYAFILMKNANNRPGFALLQLVFPCYTSEEIIKSCVKIHNGYYISSSRIREQSCKNMSSSAHGPCSNFKTLGQEFDFAYCFSSDFWPPLAYPWIQRCKTWPPLSVLQDIVRNGCHFVAIGNRGSQHEGIEWRTSFSVAEQKLVYNMNHCQFLVYGLLKLFLKEVIHHNIPEHEKLLCSYFMKTALFWQIQENKIPLWCPENLLICFWSCFKCIIHWVYKGVCPNFFIPENNMFCEKVQGQSQKRLFLQLYDLYEKGLSCLLKCASITSFLSDVLYHPTCIIRTKSSMLTEVDNEMNFWRELYTFGTSYTAKLSVCLQFLDITAHLLQCPITQQQDVFLQKITTSVLETAAFLLHNNNKTSCNKVWYILDKTSRNMLQISAKFGCTSDMLYLAMYYYKTFREAEAISVIEKAKVKLSQVYLMNMENANKQGYIEDLRGYSLSFIFRRAVAMTVILNKDISYIKELQLEQKMLPEYATFTGLFIPPIILLHMLSVLLNKHDNVKQQQALDDISVILNNDDGIYVPLQYRDISWHILGICQELCKDWESALHSYHESLQQPFNQIQTATHVRIQHAKKHLTGV